jgi:hypothetical protein
VDVCPCVRVHTTRALPNSRFDSQAGLAGTPVEFLETNWETRIEFCSTALTQFFLMPPPDRSEQLCRWVRSVVDFGLYSHWICRQHLRTLSWEPGPEIDSFLPGTNEEVVGLNRAIPITGLDFNAPQLRSGLYWDLDCHTRSSGATTDLSL